MADMRGGGGRGQSRAGEDLEEIVVKVKRCAKVVKGGKRFSFKALVVVGDYRNCSAVLRDPTVSSDRQRSLLGATFGATPDEVPADSFLSMDAPDHTRLRGLVAKAFTPRVIANL